MLAGSKMSHSLTFITGLRGFHFYRRVWEPNIGEVILLERQPENQYDKHAIAGRVIKKEDTITMQVGHLPKEISKVISNLLK